ncbi:MAG: tetratricopeptide repeat protein [Myxococcaceae bacterium]
MPRFAAVLLFAATASLAGQSRPLRPPVDEQAMREAIKSSAEVEEDFASSASYAHFLRSRMFHFQGESRKALDELHLAVASDESNPFLQVAIAEEYARLSDLDHAEKELKKVIDQSPNYFPAQLMMGRVLMEGHKYTRARMHLRRAIKLKPKDEDGYLALAQLHLELNQPEEATKVVDELASAIPTESFGLKRLGLAFAERGEQGRAEKLLKRAAERNPTDAEVWSTLAQLYDAQGKNEDAERAYSEALQREPEDRELLLAAARLALKQNDDPSAKAYFDQLLSQTEEPELWVKVAFSYLAAHRVENAAEVLDNARKLNTGEPRISFYAGLVHEKLHRFAPAADAYGEVPEGSELFHEARLHRAMCLSGSGQHQKALELFKQGIAERPDYTLLYPAYARALEQAGNVREAEAVLNRELKLHPSPELWDAISQTYARQGKVGDAIELLNRALKENPKDESLLFTLGTAYERKGDVEKSLQQMRAVLAINPDHAEALNFLGYSLADRNQDIDEAERLVTRALELKPDEGSFVDSLGWVYYRRGDYGRAVSTLERAVALMPDEPLVIEHLGDAYRSASRVSDAMKAYKRALDLIDSGKEQGERAELMKKLKSLHASP